MTRYSGCGLNRSPNAGNTTNFCNVNTNGTANNNNANNAYGIAPFGYIIRGGCSL